MSCGCSRALANIFGGGNLETIISGVLDSGVGVASYGRSDIALAESDICSR